MKFEKVREVFQDAIDSNMYYVGVLIHMEGFKENELIINQSGNFENKLAYYEKTYDENCIHKFSPTISIVDAMSTDYIDDFEYMFVDE